MSELKQVETWYDSIKHLSNDTKGALNFITLIIYIYCYYRQTLSTLLEKEFTGTNDETVDDKIRNFITLTSSKIYKSLAEELSRKYIHLNIKSINNILTQTQLSEAEFIAKNYDIIESFYDTEMMLANLTYKDHPIESFSRFMERYHINLESNISGDHVFIFTFEGKPLKKYKKFECDTVYELLNFCSPILLEKVSNELLSHINNSSVLKNHLQGEFDFDNAKGLKGDDLFQYLNRFEYIRMKFFLEDLYLLLYYDKIDDFKNKTMMEKLKISSIQKDINIDILNKNQYCQYKK